MSNGPTLKLQLIKDNIAAQILQLYLSVSKAFKLYSLAIHLPMDIRCKINLNFWYTCTARAKTWLWKETILALSTVFHNTCQRKAKIVVRSYSLLIITRMWANAQCDGCPAKYRWRLLFNAAKFGWRPLLECRAVTLPRRETRWNLLGCPKLANRSQPLMGRSSPYGEDMWRR